MALPISSRSAAMFLRNASVSARSASASFWGLSNASSFFCVMKAFARSSSLARANELKVPLHVETIAAWNLVLAERLFGDGVVLAVHLRVAMGGKATLGGPLDDLAARAAVTGVLTLGLRIDGAPLGGRRRALDVLVVAGAPVVGPLRLAASRPAVLAPLPVSSALAAALREHQDLLAVRTEHPNLASLPLPLPLPLP